MPSAVCQKPLKMAESISQLNSQIQVTDITLNRIKSAKKSSLIEHIEKIQKEADRHMIDGDEENAYILYMRAIEICQRLSPKPKETSLKEKIKYCLLNSEKLSESLKRRYELLRESKLARENEERASLNQKVNGGIDSFGKQSLKYNDKNNHCDTDGRVSNIIEPLGLHSIIENVIKNSSNHSPILLLDIRTSEDFQKSHMEFKKNLSSPNVKLIHVPEEKLESGMAMSKLLKILSLNHQLILKERHKALKVVLFDWTSESIPSSGPLKIVYDCLWKWDSSSEKLLSPPCILKNGYNGWLTTYPIYVTNPMVQPPTKIDFVPCLPQIDDFYESAFRKEIEKEVPPPGPEFQPSIEPLNNGTHMEPDEGTNQSNSIVTRLTSNNLKDITSKIPGSAQLVPPILPNRSLKPKMIINTDKTSSSRIKTNSMTEVKVDDGNHSTPPLSSPSISEIEFKTRKQIEAIEEMNRINMEEGEKDRMAKQYPKQNFDERNKINERMPSLKNKLNLVNGTKDDEGGIVSRKTERTVSESVDMPNVPPTLSKTSRSLSRSYSSPNIADHLEDDEAEDKENRPDPPVFDRSLKPPALRMNNFSRSTSVSARSRNFSPIYGIPGQSNTGLKNLGNTCFMNAVLQCLADTPDLRRYFMSEVHLGDINRNSRLGSRGELAIELGALTREIRSYQYKNVTPADFKESVLTHMPFFVGGEQQDAHEFLCMLLEKLHADLNRAKPKSPNGIINLSDDLPAHIAIKKFWNDHHSKNESKISDLFEGLLMSTLRCTVCDKQSNTFEVFMNLSIPIPTRLGHRCTLANCLDLFTDEERLSGEAAWDCPSCKTKRDATKRIRICKLPRILVIHLKRFSYEGKWRQKLQNLVEFPLVDLSLDAYKAPSLSGSAESSYDLYGVVNHNGTLEGGHYVAYCKNEEKGKWYEYDDHEVTELSAADVKSHAAYLLFYTARNVERIH